MSFLFTATFAVNAQNYQSSISGDNCITFDSCPSDQTVCANDYKDGVFGAYLDWDDPFVTQTCTPNGRPGNFQMLFELNEQLLTVDCWEFNYISRVGTDGGQVKLFSGEDRYGTKNSVIITPYLILRPNSETSIDVDYVNGDYSVRLVLIDENGNEVYPETALQVEESTLTYTFFTDNPTTGVYRLKYVFEFKGKKEPSNANNGDTLIAVDGMLSESDNCSTGVDFTVTAPDKGFYPVGIHDLQYVATYTAPDGTTKVKTCSFTITVTELEVQVSNVTPVECDGTGGSFTATGSGINGSGTPPYQYSIDGTNFQSNGNFNGLSAGPYTVTVKDVTGCTAQADVTIDQLAPVTANISGNGILTCANPSITLDAGGSTVQGTVSYLWSTGATSQTINVTAAGDYSVTVTDTNSGCSDTATVTVVENKTPAVATITGNQTLTCDVTSVTLDASTSTADGNFTYLWSNGSTDASITVTEPNTYSVTITGENGCEDTASTTVDQNITPAVATITGNEILTCNVTSVTLDASTSTADGNFTYLWSNGSTDASITVTEPNTYSVTITGENGCEDTASTTVDQNITPAVATITGNEILTCDVTSVTLDASTSTADGSFTYLWSNGSTDASITVTEPNTYSVTITGENGCEDTASVTVDQNITPAVATITGNEILTCDVTSVTLDASTSTADGNFTYLWSNGSTDASITVTEPNNYSVIITGENGCEDTVSATVDQNITPAVATITGNEILTCEVTSVTLDASTSTADGNFTYLWSNGSTDASITVTEPNTYSVTITGENGCEDTASTTVDQNITPAVAKITGNEVLTCDVTSVTLDASTSTADGNFTYLWSNGSTDASITVTEPNTYAVTITGENGCEDTVSATVDQNITPAVATITGNEILTCDVTSVTLDASTSTADGSFTYLWSNGSTDASITVTEPNTYSVTITGENGCEDTASTTVDQNITPAVATITGNEILTCDVTSATLDASTSTADGNFAYLWSNGSTDASITVTEPNTYSVTITGENGCSAEASVTVEAFQQNPAAPELSGAPVQPTCAEPTGSFEIVAVEGLTYSINGGEFTSTTTFNDLAPATYSVVAKNEYGCTSEPLDVNIEAQPDTPAAPIIHVTVHPSCGETTGSFGICCDNGLEYSLDGENFQRDPIFMDLEPGYYEVVARNAEGCLSVPTPVTINEAPETPAAPEIASIEQPSCEVPTGSFTVTTETGLEYSIDGTNWQTEASFENLPADAVYEVVARNADGCISEATSVTIEAQPETPAAPAIASTQQPSCEVPLGSFTVTAEAGLEYSINGTDFYTSGEFNDLAPDTYEVVARNADGCISEATQVTINAQPETPAAPAVASTQQPTCEVPTGSFTVTTETGLEYSIDGSNWQAEGSFEDLPADVIYEVVARNAEGCISEATSVTINAQPETPAAPEIASNQQPSCDVPTGSFSVATQAGMEYSINGTDFYASGEFNDLAPDTYQVVARNADGCISAATTVTINAQPETPAAPVVEDLLQPSCDEPSGMVVLTYIEGITYILTDEAGNATPDTDEDGIFDGLASGSYTITAENVAGCISEGTPVTIDEQPEVPIAPEVSFTQPTCEVPTGSLTITAEEGILYRLNDGELSAETSFTELDPATYTVVAVNAEGCESQPITVTLNEPQAPVITPEDPMSLCIEEAVFDLNNMLRGEFDQSGTWEDPANTGALENGSIDPSLLALGTYTFNYVIEGNCPSTTSVEININDDCVVLACELEDVKESISKVVTPNGDGINEYFTVGLDLDCGFIYHVQIFNRWGNKVYESDNYQNNWDGTSRSSFTGDQLPAGTYYYIVQIEGLEPIQGYIYLGTK